MHQALPEGRADSAEFTPYVNSAEFTPYVLGIRGHRFGQAPHLLGPDRRIVHGVVTHTGNRGSELAASWI